MTGKNSLMKFKRCIVKLKRCMKYLQPVRPIASDDEDSTSLTIRTMVPKGHFAVLVQNGEKEKKRFLVELRHLRNSALLKLLKEAEEEYGFQQEGALVVPCRPEELQMILGDNTQNN